MTRKSLSPALLLGWMALGIVVAAGLAWPLIAFDDWWYHFVFAAKLWGIGGPDSFVMDARTTARWEGLPKAWHWLMGAAWAIAGSLRAVIVPQMLLLVAFLFQVRRLLGVPVPFAALGLVASPMLLIHSQAIYIDLPVGLCLAAAFLSLLVSIDHARSAGWPMGAGQAALGAAALGLAGNTKFQGTIGAMLVFAIAATLALAVPGIAARRRLLLVAVMSAGLALACATLLANAWRFGNPVYPFDVRTDSRVLLAGVESSDTDDDRPIYLLQGSRELHLPGPLNFVLSLTELDWTMRGVAPWYNIDAYSGALARRGPPSRTGGLGAVFVLVNLGLLAWQAARRRSLADSRQRILVLGAVLLLVGTAFLPRAYELRYWLVVPLVMAAVNLRFLAGLGWPRWSRAGLLTLAAHGVALSLLSPRSQLLARPPVAQADLRAAMPLHVAEALAQRGHFCDPDDRELFRYSFAITGLPGRVSRREEDCR